MPIYGYGLLGAPYVVDNNITKQDLLKFEQIFNKILYKNYQYTHPEFVRSIDLNYKVEYNFIALFHSSKCNLDTYRYQSLMEELINKCNEYILNKQSGPFKDRKIDITGSWTEGAVIILTKNNKSILNKKALLSFNKRSVPE